MRRLATLVVVLVACAPRVATVNLSAPSRGDKLLLAKGVAIPVPRDRVASAKKLVAELRAALVVKDEARASKLVSGGQLLASVSQRLVTILSAPEVRFRVEPICPAGPGLYVRFVVLQGGLFADPNAMIEMYAGPEEGEWRLFPAGPRDAVQAALLSETARIRVDPAEGTVEGIATLKIRTSERFVPIELDLTGRDDEGTAVGDGYELKGLEQDGAALAFQVLPFSDVVVAQLATTAGSIATIRVAWQGKPGAQLNYVTPQEVMLHEAKPWFPVLSSTDADFELFVEHPAGFDLLAEGGQKTTALKAGWRETRVTVHADRGTTLFGRPRYETRETALGDARVRLAVSPEKAKLLPTLVADIGKTWDGLKLLGPLPSKDLRIVESSPPPGIAAVGGRSFIALGPGALERTTVAHELAHSWFGGLISSSFKGDWGGQWPEPLAEFVVQWTLTDEQGWRERSKWSDCYGHEVGPESALRSTQNAGLGRQLLYCKGPLILAQLEGRIGRPALQQAFTSFVKNRAGKPSSWAEIVAEVRAASSDEHAVWLESRLSREGAPGFAIEGLARTEDKINGTLIQRRDWGQEVFEEDVEIGFLDRRTLPIGATKIVSVTARKTLFSIPLPEGAVSIAIDPERRLPWKHLAKPDTGQFPLPK